MKDVAYCNCCGAIVRIYGAIYKHYECRWFEGHWVTVCQDCEYLLPEETEEDKPERYRRNNGLPDLWE